MSEKAKQKHANTNYVKCEGCGANMSYEPEIGKLKCPYCGSEKELPSEGYAKEIDLLKGFSEDDAWTNEETSVFSCQNCGAKVVLSSSETAKTCPFCATPHVEKVEEMAGLRPNGVLPFTIGINRAIELSKAWAKRKLFAPRKFKKNLNYENVHGVYAPCFTFDSLTTTTYEGRIGVTHTRTVGSGKNRRTETYTVWRYISGVYDDAFDDVLITAGSKLDQKRLDKLSPFDTNCGRTYNSGYLMGFMAYRYDYEITDCWKDAKAKMDAVIKRKILSKYVHDKVAYFNTNTSHERVTYKYVMLPVFVGVFKYTKKAYNFFVNGNTGRVTGKTPVSPIRVILAVVLGIAFVVLFAYLMSKG